MQHLLKLLHPLPKPEPIPFPRRNCSQHRSSLCLQGHFGSSKGKERSRRFYLCKSCCISDQNLLCSTARCGLCLTVQSLGPLAVHRERAGEGRTPEQSSARAQLGPGTGTESQMAESQIPGQQGQNPKWQITSGSGSSENGGENP